MYRYETHLHTSPASRCASADVAESIAFYRQLGYAGVFITNHFLDGNVGGDRTLPYRDQLDFYFADYYAAKALETPEFSVFLGVEHSYKGTDFLIYGIKPSWYYDHPEILEMKKSELLPMLTQAGALVIQAHPFREARYIDHIRLFPRSVHGVEVVNASCLDSVNEMGRIYADQYGLLHFAGSDNHSAAKVRRLGGIECAVRLTDEEDLVRRTLAGEITTFSMDNPLLA